MILGARMQGEIIAMNEDQGKRDKIPKIIHYCWFGQKPLPEELKRCMDSWGQLKDYTIMRWDESNCSFDENEFVRKTYAEKKLGFIGDYYRLKAVYEYGGIYLDTDVMVYQSFDELLSYPVFLNFIFDCAVGSAVIGARKGSPLIKALLDMYEHTSFGRNPSGKIFEWRNGKLIVDDYATSNYYYTYYILSHYPQFMLNNKFQDLGDFVIFSKEYFEVGTLFQKHYTVHFCAGEWRPKENPSNNVYKKIKAIIQKNQKLFSKVQIITRRVRYYRLKRSIPFYPYYLAQKKRKKLPEF